MRWSEVIGSGTFTSEHIDWAYRYCQCAEGERQGLGIGSKHQPNATFGCIYCMRVSRTATPEQRQRAIKFANYISTQQPDKALEVLKEIEKDVFKSE